MVRFNVQRVDAGTPVAQVVRDYIDRRPLVRDALALGIVNLSALARHIMEDTGLNREDAVVMAIRRYEPDSDAGGEARRIAAECRLEIHTGFQKLLVRGDWRILARVADGMDAISNAGHPVYVLHGREAVTVLTDDQVAQELAAFLGRNILDQEGGFVGIIVHAEQDLQAVPGFLALLVGTLASHDINLVEVVSSHNDTLLLVAADDLGAAVTALGAITRS